MTRTKLLLVLKIQWPSNWDPLQHSRSLLEAKIFWMWDVKKAVKRLKFSTLQNQNLLGSLPFARLWQASSHNWKALSIEGSLSNSSWSPSSHSCDVVPSSEMSLTMPSGTPNSGSASTTYQQPVMPDIGKYDGKWKMTLPSILIPILLAHLSNEEFGKEGCLSQMLLKLFKVFHGKMSFHSFSRDSNNAKLVRPMIDIYKISKTVLQ